MKWNINCKEATHLVLQAEDTPLGVGDRMRLRLHMAICRACPNFERQVSVMRHAMRHWRERRDHGEIEERPPGKP